jgi:hypothetical protein
LVLSNIGPANHILQEFVVDFYSNASTVKSVEAIFTVDWSDVIQVSGCVNYASDVRLPSLGFVTLDVFSDQSNKTGLILDFGYLGGMRSSLFLFSWILRILFFRGICIQDEHRQQFHIRSSYSPHPLASLSFHDSQWNQRNNFGVC